MYPPPPYGHVPNPYMPPPPGVAPNGISHYPGSYQTMARPGFPPRPMNPIGVGPQISRPPIPGMLPIVRPVVPIVAPTEKPQTTVYVGKIAASVGNDFMQSLLLLCGPVKSWKRAQDPSNGTPKGFGFCEFEAAEGVLRALRLLTKLSIDGQELSLNINQATREYLERYVEKKTEREKIKETENNPPDKESESAGAEKDLPKADVEETKNEEDSTNKKNHENQKFGIVTDQDVNLDKDALEKITAMIDERIKNRPLPPPPPIPSHADASARSNSEKPSKSRDGDSDIDITRNADDKNDDELTSEAKAETNSPDRGRRHDRRSRDRDRERDPKREKDRELDRYERERERERIRREKERDTKVKEAERIYRERVKEWEDREKDKERHRRDEKEREKERQRKRRNMILKEEDGSEDEDEGDSRKRRRRSNMLEEKRRKRQREKEEDMYDRVKEEEEIAEAKKKAVEEQKRVLKSPATHVAEESKNVVMQEDGVSEHKESSPAQQAHETVTGSGNDTGNEIYKNSSDGQISGGLGALPDTKQNNDAPTKKLGFGLVGSGKRTTVQSVFHEEDDENVDDKKMRPLVPIDYSTEELQAVQTPVSSAPANLVAAAEFAKRLSGSEKLEMEKERNGRPSERTSHRERDRNDNDNTRHRNESKDKVRDRSSERERGRDRERDRERERERDREGEAKPKAENKKLLDAKQLIDMIPKTKEELFAYEINWAVYDEHELHERMRPWISKKINDFLGEEEATLVDYIVSSTKDHVQASKMLELLQAILDDEAEMFVLKMWRMLIFEIKKVETGLSAKART